MTWRRGRWRTKSRARRWPTGSPTAIVLVFTFGCQFGGPRTAEAPSVEVIEQVKLRFCPASEKPSAGWIEQKDERGQRIYVGPPSDLTEADVLSAVAMHGLSQSMLRLLLTNVGSARLAELTRDNVGRRMAILIDDRLVSSPRVLQEIDSSEAVISGDFGRNEADEIALALTRNAQASQAARRAAQQKSAAENRSR